MVADSAFRMTGNYPLYHAECEEQAAGEIPIQPEPKVK
jgi:hypothetical protein